MWRAVSISLFWGIVGGQECGSKRQHAVSSPSASGQGIYIQIVRTGCYGRCPIDKVELLPDGVVRYHGERFVPRLGVYTRRLSPQELKQAEELLRAGKFETYAEVYDNPGVSDLPSLVLVYQLEGREKKITCRTGCPPELPEKIEQLRVFLAEQGNFQMEKGPETDEETLKDPGHD